LTFNRSKKKTPRRLDLDAKENALTQAEVVAFEQAIKTDKQAYIYILCGIFGMRIGEVVHCKLDWFDLTEGRESIKIPRQMKCDCTECKNRPNKGVWSPKTRAGARTIPARICLSYFYSAHEYLKNGGSVGTQRACRYMIHVIAKRAKIPHTVFPHALRATAATKIAAMQDMNSVRITNIMGWESIKIADEYIRASGIDVLRAFEPKVLGQDVIETPSFVKKHDEEQKFEEFKGNETKSEDDVCTMCGEKVVLKEDGSWECSACGATSNL